MIRISVSPCSNPDLTLDEVLSAYGEIGYRRFEVFSGWAKSAADVESDPGPYRRALERHGFEASSLHLPPLTDDLDASLPMAVAGCRFAVGLGCPVVLYKARSRQAYVAGAGPFLDAIEGLPVTPVLQNHRGSALESLEDFAAIRAGIGDPRIQCLLEVGQFHSVGVRWPEGYRALDGAIALVHIKDQVGAQSVPFGTGEIDLPGLFRRLKEDGYDGDVVVEMEVVDRQNTLAYLRDAFAYVKELL